EEERKRQEELMTKERHASLVIRKQVDEGFNSQMKLKLKVADTITPDTQLLLNLKKGSCESRESHILKQLPKGLREGSGVQDYTETKSGSFDNPSWASDEKCHTPKRCIGEIRV
ncbi:hypothetical protein Tco_0135660, partial [Tanacetum coccineum]